MPTIQQSLFRQEPVQYVPYVASDLRMVQLSAPEAGRQDVMIDGVWHRRLDAQYFLWIEQQVELARELVVQGSIRQPAFDVLMSRYRTVKRWVDDNLGVDKLKAARKLFVADEYMPPTAAQPVTGSNMSSCSSSSNTTPHLYPADGDWKFVRHVPREAVAKVDAIRDRALACGWTEARLYQNRGNLRYPCGDEWGLVCALDDNPTIGEVQRRYIEIITRNGVRQRFYNFDVDQPWLRKVKPAGRDSGGNHGNPVPVKPEKRAKTAARAAAGK